MSSTIVMVVIYPSLHLWAYILSMTEGHRGKMLNSVHGWVKWQKKKKKKTVSAPLLQFMIEDFLGLASKLHYHGLC